MVVPLAAQSIVASATGIVPPMPVMCTTPPPQSGSTVAPRVANPAAMTRVSSLSSTPVSVLGPRAKAAQTKARFVMLLEPGGRMLPLTGAVTTGMASGADIMSEEGPRHGWSRTLADHQASDTDCTPRHRR